MCARLGRGLQKRGRPGPIPNYGDRMHTKSLGLFAGRILKAVLGAALVLGSGCSGGSSSSGSAGVADCASACQRVAALHCPQDQPEATCEQSCNQPLVAACVAQTNAAFSCLATAELQCAANGKAATSSCLQQQGNLTACVFGALFSQDGGFSLGDAGFSLGDSNPGTSCVGNACPQGRCRGLTRMRGVLHQASNGLRAQYELQSVLLVRNPSRRV